MKKVILLGSVLICSLVVVSQENYLPGYIVGLKGDTVRGYVDYREWDKNPESFDFKAEGQGEAVNYRPGRIAGFFVAGNLYRSAAVDVEISPYKTSDLNFDPELQLIRDTVFLQVIVDGEKGLCYLKPASGKQLYYITQNDEFELLIFKKFYSSNSNASQTATRTISYNNKYVGQLTLFLTNCPGIQQKLYTVEYKWRDLQKLFDHYYECTNMVKVYEGEARSTKIEWSILAGPTLTFVKFETSYTDEHQALVNADFDPSFFFATGVAMDVIFPGIQEKWSFNNELMITSYKVEGFYQDYHNEKYYTDINMELGGAYLQLNTMGRFKYPVKKAYLFANAGITGALMIVLTDYAKSEKHFYSSYDVTEGNALDDVKEYEIGFLGGLGVRFSHFSGEFRYEYSTGMSPYNGLTSPVNRLFFLVGYRF
jgi:hypothetical protein